MVSVRDTSLMLTVLDIVMVSSRDTSLTGFARHEPNPDCVGHCHGFYQRHEPYWICQKRT